MAPETLDDQSLRDLMKTHLNNKEAITSAIQNIWHDTPDNKAVGSDWVTTSKNKKQEAPPAKSSVGGRGSREGGGRGGSARGRGPANAGRGGSGGGRGERDRDRTGSRGPSSKPSYANGGAEQSNGTSSTVAATAGWGTQSDAVFTSDEPAEAPKPPQVSAVPSAPVGWGGGLTLAERLKKKAEEVKSRLIFDLQKSIAACVLLANEWLQEAKKPEAADAAEKAADAEEQAAGRKGASRQRGRRRDKDRGRRGSEGNAADKDGDGSVSASPAVAADEAAIAEAGDAEQALASETHQELEAVDQDEDTLQNISDALHQLTTAADEVLSGTDDQRPESQAVPVPVPVPAAADPAPTVAAAVEAASQPGKAEPSSSASLPASNSSSSFLKLGKWEAPIEAAPEAAVFQFGSFGAEESMSSAAASSKAVGAGSSKSSSWQEEPLAHGLQESSSAWSSEVSPSNPGSATVPATSAPSTSAPSSSASGGASNASSSMNALFAPVSKVAGLQSLDSQASNAAAAGIQSRAPPGLEQGSVLPAASKQNPIQPGGGGSNGNRSAPGQQVRYNTAGGLAAPVTSLPAYYPPVGFDQYASYPPNSSVSLPLGGSQAVNGVGSASGLGGSAGSAAGATSNASNVGVNSGIQQQQPQQQQQQQFPAASLPYYGAPPYYGQYYYGQQVPNYYGQGRGIYQQPRGPYPTEMYGSAGSLYPGEVYAGNQFSDAPNYGGMAMQHQGGVGGGAANIPGSASGGVGAGGVGASGPAGNKALKGGAGGGLSIPGAQQQQQQQPQVGQNQQAGNVGLMGAPDHSAHLNSSYGYGANPYNRSFGMDAQWQQFQQGQGWAPMMAFPSSAPNPSAAGGGVGLTAHNQGFTQQPQQQQQQHVGMGMGGPSVQQGLPMQQQGQGQNQQQQQQQRSAFPGQGGRNAGGSAGGGGSW
eukprot:gene31304-40676_t